MKKTYHQILAFVLISALALSINVSALRYPNSANTDQIDATSPHIITAEPYWLTSVPVSPEFESRTQQSSTRVITTTREDNVWRPQPTPITKEAIKASTLNTYSRFMYGQEVRAGDGAVYFASADQLGSGRQGIANNPYTSQLYIAGFALVRVADGHLLASQCYMRDHVPVGKTMPTALVELMNEYDLDEVKLFIATYTDGFTTGSVGWFPVDSLTWRYNSLAIDYVEPTYDDDDRVNGYDTDEEPVSTTLPDGSGLKDPANPPTYSDCDTYHPEMPSLSIGSGPNYQSEKPIPPSFSGSKDTDNLPSRRGNAPVGGERQ